MRVAGPQKAPWPEGTFWEDPIPHVARGPAERPETAGLRGDVRQGVASAEADEFANCRFDVLRRNVGENRGDLWILFDLRFDFGCDRGGRQRQGRKSEKDDEFLEHKF